VDQGIGEKVSLKPNSGEFTAIPYGESRDAIRRFTGDDIEKTRHPSRDPEYLLEIEETVTHFDVLLDHH